MSARSFSRPSATAVRRIDDERRAVVELEVNHVRGAVSGVRVGVRLGIGQHCLVDAITDGEVAVAGPEQARGSSSELGDLVVGQCRSALERLGPFERRGGVNEPDTLKVRLTIGGARRGPGLRRRPRRAHALSACQEWRARDEEDRDDAHTAAHKASVQYNDP